jgi:hypothetical protein
MNTSERPYRRRWEGFQAVTSLLAVVVAAGSVYLTTQWEARSRLAFDVNALEIICSPQFEAVMGESMPERNCTVLAMFPPSSAVTREYVRLVVEHPENVQGITEAYLDIYPRGIGWMGALLQEVDSDPNIDLPPIWPEFRQRFRALKQGNVPAWETNPWEWGADPTPEHTP